MCLLVFQYADHPDYSLIFGGNRDEFYGRPTAPADLWEEAPHVLAGRDLKAGGTWMGVTKHGYWGVVTNIRDSEPHHDDARSRGTLVSEYLVEEPDPRAYLEQVAADAAQYNGFNLLVGTTETLFYLSNRDGVVHEVEPGLHGLSNDRLDTPWPKVRRAKTQLRSQMDGGGVTPGSLLELLNDRRSAPDDELPETGLGRERERMLSPIFIDGEQYGTRSSTVLLIGRDGRITFVERPVDSGDLGTARRFSFHVTAPSGA